MYCSPLTARLCTYVMIGAYGGRTWVLGGFRYLSMGRQREHAPMKAARVASEAGVTHARFDSGHPTGRSGEGRSVRSVTIRSRCVRLQSPCANTMRNWQSHRIMFVIAFGVQCIFQALSQLGLAICASPRYCLEKFYKMTHSCSN